MSALGNGSVSGFEFKTDSVTQLNEPLGAGGFTYKYASNQVGGKRNTRKHRKYKSYKSLTSYKSLKSIKSKSKSIRSATPFKQSRLIHTLKVGGKRRRRKHKK